MSTTSITLDELLAKVNSLQSTVDNLKANLGKPIIEAISSAAPDNPNGNMGFNVNQSIPKGISYYDWMIFSIGRSPGGSVAKTWLTVPTSIFTSLSKTTRFSGQQGYYVDIRMISDITLNISGYTCYEIYGVKMGGGG